MTKMNQSGRLQAATALSEFSWEDWKDLGIKLFAKHPTIFLKLTDEARPARWKELAKAGEKIPAIKALRIDEEIDLGEAKERVEQWLNMRKGGIDA